MYFRLTYQVSGYPVESEETAHIRIGGPDQLSVTLQHLPDDPNAPGEAVVLLVGSAELDPPPKAAKALRDLALTSDSAEPEKTTGPPLVLSGTKTLNFSRLPGPLQVFYRKLYSDLVDAMTSAFELVRWRFSMPGPVRPYSSRGLEWSDDGETWHQIPPDINLRLTATPHQRFSPEGIAQIETMISSRVREPLAHSLLREARGASATRSYATALVMAMSALEIGIKQLIGLLIPAASWLAENSPSPPVVSIISDYLPTLPARLGIKNQPIVPPPRLVETVKKATHSRNKTIHAGNRDLDPDFVLRVIDTVADLLWIFDVYAGNAWALNHVSAETRAELASTSEN